MTLFDEPTDRVTASDVERITQEADRLGGEMVADRIRNGRRCVACGIGERYRPGPWIDCGRFQPARLCGSAKLPPIVSGPICPDCKSKQPKE